MNKVTIDRELRSVLGMILNALDRDTAEGKTSRGEMAAELRALLAQQQPKQDVVGAVTGEDEMLSDALADIATHDKK